MSEELQQKLRTQLWAVANNLRGNMSANEFMYFSLGFIFYKYLSEKIEKYANQALENDEITFKQLWGSQEEEAVELQDEVKKQCLENIGYFVEPQFLFTSIIDGINRKENILPQLERSLKRIEDSTLGQESEEDFGGLFSDIDLASPKLGKTADDKNNLISSVLTALNGIDFGADEATQIDILGDAYEYMISQFAAGAGKKAGEFYTPQEVSRILAEIVTLGHARLRNVYDPTCGSGSLLIRAANIGKAVEIFGQEKNPTTYNLARMNMLLHGIKFSNFKIENGDTLEADAFGDRQFDAVVANPPFSAEWSAADKFNNDDRFSKAGRLAPRKTADYAFILHMIYHLNDGGTMACVAPHGVLFRGNAEGAIRRFLIENKNYVDAIIGLPANIFYGTSIPTCIIVMKKCRKEDDNILFIDASKEFEKVKTQNKLREEHIRKIVETYRDRKEIEKYSHCASLQEIADNDYNLNIPRYVDTFEEEEPIDIKAVMAEIKELEAKRADLDKEIEGYLRELGIVDNLKDNPYGTR
ncbi:MAG: type I restriction-modification system subunit M [Odoribacter sp.]|nr:type I restriction-modification system subunit M [Odoribacter sp.]